MKTKMFCVYDSKALIFGVPFFMPKEQMAIRAFSDLVNDPSTLVSKHPEDFSLFYVGDFDDENGLVEGVKHVGLAGASSFKVLPKNGVIAQEVS